jgi:hypothetical protein
MSKVLFIDNSNVIKIPVLTVSDSGLPDLGASVSVTVMDSAGAEVSGETWPVSMAHAGAGEYKATLSDSLALTKNAVYTARVTATGSGGQKGRWNCKVVAQERPCS